MLALLRVPVNLKLQFEDKGKGETPVRVPPLGIRNVAMSGLEGLSYGGLCCSEPRDGNAEWGAADIG